MQGRAMYQGQPTSNMIFPTEAYVGAHAQAYRDIGQAAASAAQTKAAAMQKLGSDIGQGLIGAAGAYSDYKKLSSQVKADSAAFDALKNYLPSEVASVFQEKRNAIESNAKSSLEDKAAFYNSAKSYIGAALGQKYKLDQINAEAQGGIYKTLAGKEHVPDLSAAAQGLKYIIGGNQPAPVAPQAAPVAPQSTSGISPQTRIEDLQAPSFDPRNGADMLNKYMSDKYGYDWRKKGIKASKADVDAMTLQ